MLVKFIFSGESSLLHIALEFTREAILGAIMRLRPAVPVYLHNR